MTYEPKYNTYFNTNRNDIMADVLKRRFADKGLESKLVEEKQEDISAIKKEIVQNKLLSGVIRDLIPGGDIIALYFKDVRHYN